MSDHGCTQIHGILSRGCTSDLRLALTDRLLREEPPRRVCCREACFVSIPYIIGLSVAVLFGGVVSRPGWIGHNSAPYKPAVNMVSAPSSRWRARRHFSLPKRIKEVFSRTKKLKNVTLHGDDVAGAVDNAVACSDVGTALRNQTHVSEKVKAFFKRNQEQMETFWQHLNVVSSIASTLCAFNCIVFPLLLTIFPLISVFATGPGMAWMMKISHAAALYFVGPIGTVTCLTNFMKHRRWLVLLWGFIGMALIIGINIHVVCALLIGLVPHALASFVHPVVNILGCIFLLSSQWYARRLIKKSGKSCCAPKNVTGNITKSSCCSKTQEPPTKLSQMAKSCCGKKSGSSSPRRLMEKTVDVTVEEERQVEAENIEDEAAVARLVFNDHGTIHSKYSTPNALPSMENYGFRPEHTITSLFVFAFFVFALMGHKKFVGIPRFARGLSGPSMLEPRALERGTRNLQLAYESFLRVERHQ